MNANGMSPVYIIGSERSGTNLLRRLVSNHSRIAGPLSPHLINSLYNWQRFYGTLSDHENARVLFNDMINIANHPFSNWDIKVSYEEFVKNSPVTFLNMVDHLYSTKVQSEGKPRYISKELNAHVCIDELLLIKRDTKFLHLVRDPREQVASWMRTPLVFVNVHDAILDWIKTQEQILNKACIFPDNIKLIRYEDLVVNTVNTMKDVLMFINEEIEEECFQTSISKENTNWNELWKNLNKPIENNLSKHREVLSRSDIQMIETLAGELMEELGYDKISGEGQWRNNTVFKLKKMIMSRINRRKSLKVKGYELTKARTQFASDLKQNRRKIFLKKLGTTK